MRDVVERAKQRLRQEHLDRSRPEPLLACDRLGGGTVICPPTALAIDEDDLRVETGEWIAAEATIDVTGAR